MGEMSNEISTAKEYQRKKQILTLFNLFFTPAVLLLIILSPLSLRWKLWSISVGGNAYLAVAIYFVCLSVFMLIFDLPLSFYSGYYLEHRYGLSNQSWKPWVKDLFKKSLLSFVISCVLLEALYALIWYSPNLWWLYAWCGYALVSYVMGKLFPVLIVPLFYKYSRVTDEHLNHEILNLAKRFDLPIENVYALNLSRTTKKANAAFMGFGKTKRVVLSDTLITNFTVEEVKTVVAHELGHYKHHDVWRHFGFGVLISCLSFWIAFKLIGPMASHLGYYGVHDIACMPLLFLIFYVLGIVLTPIHNGFARWLERGADRFAIAACPDKNVFASCMKKLGSLNLADPDPNPIYEWFFYDHPALRKRIRMIQTDPA